MTSRFTMLRGILGGFAAFVATASWGQAASSLQECWIDAANGHVVDADHLVPNGGRLDPIDPKHVSFGGRTFFKSVDGSWADAANGHVVDADHLVPNGGRLDPSDPKHISFGGRTFVRVPCPPPTETVNTAPVRTATYSGLHAGAIATGPYVSLGAGIQQFNGVQIDNALGQAVGTRYNVGYDIGGSIGYDFGHIRPEIEFGYRSGGLKTLDPPGGPLIDGAGSVDAFSLMGNVLIDILPSSKIDPFIGGGIGAVWTKVRDLRPATLDVATFDSKSDPHFGYQGIAGISVAVSDRVNVDLAYHYRSTDVPVYASNGLQTSSRFQSHSLTLTVAYNFGERAPPPPFPPPPPPPPPKEQ